MDNEICAATHENPRKMNYLKQTFAYLLSAEAQQMHRWPTQE